MEESTNNKKVGRPAGANKLRAGFRKWQPKTWKVEYEAILLMHCKGMTNVEIAELTDFSEVHVGNIINCVDGQKFLEKVRANISESTKSLEEMYSEILRSSTLRLKRFLDDDKAFEKNPIGAVSKAMQAMEMIDSRLRASSSNVKNNTLVLATEANVDRLLNAMKKSELADQLHESNRVAVIGPGDQTNNPIGDRRSEKVG